MILSTSLLLVLQAVPTAIDADGDPAEPVRQEVSSADADWIRPLLGRPRLAVAAPADFGPTTIPTSQGPDGDLPTDVVYSVDGAYYLVAHRDTQNVLVFDAVTRAFVHEIRLSGSPLSLDVSPDGLWAATANGFEGTLSLIDLASGDEVAVVECGSVPATLDFAPDSQTVAVANFGSSSVSVVDVATATETHEIVLNSFVATITFAIEPAAVSFRGNDIVCVDATTCAVPQYFHDELAFCDFTTGNVNVVPTAADPRRVSFAPAANRLAVAHTGAARTVTLFDTVTQTIASTTPTSQDLWGPIALRFDGSAAAVAILNAGFVLNLATGAEGPTLSTATMDELIPTADGNHALGVGYRGALISFVTQGLVAQLNNQVSVSYGAVSPVAPLAAMTGASFGEDVVVVNTNGGAGAGLIEVLSSGVAPEGDVPRRLAVSADGSRAVVTNVLSDNASVLDLENGVLLGIVATGNRPSGVGITPDGSKAVVANLDSTFATVIDLATLTGVNVPISTRGAEVAIDPSGQYAYISVVSGGDGVWRIDLATNSVAGPKLITGNMGGVGGAFLQSSGITLSPDGGTLVVCGSFDDQVTLIDTATWTVRSNVPAAAFPVRAVFVPGTGRFLVSCRTSDELVVFDLNATTAVEAGRVALAFDPFEFVVDPTGARAFGLDTASDELEVVDLATFSVTASVALPGSPIALEYDAVHDAVEVLCGDYVTTIGGSVGYLVEESGQWVRVDATTFAVAGETQLGLAGSDVDSGGGRIASTAIRRDLVVAAPRAAALEADTIEISVAAGGTQQLALDAGPAFGGRVYFVVGSAHGTSPGFSFGGAFLPLVFDAYTTATIRDANTGAYNNTLGVLDANGEASASLVLPALSAPALAGISVHHAFVAFDPGFPSIGFVSNPVSLRLVP
ncbi:MAG: hypothetical protein WD226_06190 [Planctomycetota bacterium]